jgi:hypothetical protein
VAHDRTDFHDSNIAGLAKTAAQIPRWGEITFQDMCARLSDDLAAIMRVDEGVVTAHGRK